jgi:hypothetical protein
VITQEYVALLTECARARWKLEHDNNKVLKNYGYHLEHHCGHGENHASEVYCVLNLLAFLVHGLMIRCDEDFIKAGISGGGRNAIRPCAPSSGHLSFQPGKIFCFLLSLTPEAAKSKIADYIQRAIDLIIPICILGIVKGLHPYFHFSLRRFL